MVEAEIKYPNLMQLRMEMKFRRWELYGEIWKLEGLFKFTSKINDPEGWFHLQDRLGDAYRKLMTEPHPDTVKVYESRITNAYFMSKE